MNNMGMMSGKMDSGLIFAVHGGMIVNAIDGGTQMGMGGTYTIPDLPGGSLSTALPAAFYGIDAVGWSSTNSLYRAIALPQVVDLRTSDATGVAMDMLPLW